MGSTPGFWVNNKKGQHFDLPTKRMKEFYDNTWEIKERTKHWNPVYRDSLLKYLKCIGPLFEKTRSKSEFEFILTLLRVRGIQDAGWDPWETTLKVFNNMARLAKKTRDFEKQRNLSLWLYGHIIEASQPYEITANLITIIEGGRFNITNFPDVQRGKYRRPQTPSEKINKLAEIAVKINMSDSIFPFQDVFDRELRNAIFHSDYTLYREEVRILSISRYGKIYSHGQIQTLINKALAYFDGFNNLISAYISSYQSPKVISVHPEFSKDPQEKAITIVRKGYGVVGLKDNCSNSELKKGRIPFRIGHFLQYERNMLDKDPTLVVLPQNRIEKINKILKILPNFSKQKNCHHY